MRVLLFCYQIALNLIGLSDSVTKWTSFWRYILAISDYFARELFVIRMRLYGFLKTMMSRIYLGKLIVNNNSYWGVAIVKWLYNQLRVFNTLRPRQDGHHFSRRYFHMHFSNENILISIRISQSVITKGPINNIPALFQIMAWPRPGNKPLSQPIMYICVSWPQWINHADKCRSTWPNAFPF